ncbi:sensor domain-containing diguanylate cyclase [Shewanella maritima]|uniref:sensor domain-containing diguanylate cyclase n=1 Tax=Shewanella maritima TaxID=2520507 RepID=UPI0013EEBEE2|nr:sensor domain-containing diguanylate cyclase [Shewanella maritima]
MDYSAHYGVIIHRDFVPLHVDDNFAQTFGFDSANDVLALSSVLDLIAPDSRDIAAHTYYALMSGIEKPQVRSYINHRLDGTPMQVLAVEHIVEWQGRSALQITIVDLSDVMLTRDRLAASEKRYRELVDGSVQGVLVHQHFKPLFCNQAYANILGFDYPEQVLALESIISVIHPDFQKQRITVTEVLDDHEGNKLAASPKTEIKCIKPNGEEVWVELIERNIEWEGQSASQVTLTDTTEQYLLKQQLQHQAEIDELTQILNRRAFSQKAEQIFANGGDPLSHFCVLFDIDDFKHINDCFGHQIGDEAICYLVNLFAANLPHDALFGRWGGEEFVILLSCYDINNAYNKCEALRHQLENHLFSTEQHDIKLSVSLGLSPMIFKQDSISLSATINAADKALYQAKTQGKNQTVIANK